MNKGFYKLRWVLGSQYPSAFHVGDPHDESKNRQLLYEPSEPIPEIFSLIIGDVIHNLRSALDYAATKVVREAGGDTKFVTFPFHEERERLLVAHSPGLKALQGALPDADVEAFFQNTIMPFREGNFPLWALTKLDKIDKHNALILNVTTSNFHFKKFTDGMTNLRSIDIFQDVGARFALFTARNDRELDFEADLAVSICFRNSEFFGNDEVVTTLNKIGKATLAALRAFDTFVSGAKAL